MRRIIGVSGILFVLTAIFFIVRYVLLHNGAGELSYPVIVFFLLLGMGIILSGCEIFANGVECFSSRLNLSHATAGSLIAAVGTALPETMLPILAILTGAAGHKESIAVGAILGAPFMLSTLAMALLGVVTLVLWLFKRRSTAALNVNVQALKSEMLFFIPAMMFILAVSYLAIPAVNYIAGVALIILYVVFFRYAMTHEAEAGEEYEEVFYFDRYLRCPRHLRWIITQVVAGLLFIVLGAHIFVDFLAVFSVKSGIPSLFLALILAPLATELPEKFNSIGWTIKKKDTLAMANISGAMIFQSTIPVSFGLFFTTWKLGATEFSNILVALTMAGILLAVVSWKKTLPSWTLLLGGIFYLAYIFSIFMS